ncbi:MAG: nucleotidyltransferase domain-containing protein [Fidelibacterota bacterium]
MILDQSIKTQIVEKIKVVNPEKIILFGSYAKGDAKPDSDIDIMVIQDINDRDIRKKRLEIRKLLRPIIFEKSVGFDVIVDSEENVMYRINEVRDQFYSDIHQNGIVIYDK